ncbi:hypothetical protein [Pontibacter russatus]|uniref:hypothetical protein n=1 Tax=Pontibacter russatus TaxID=2694929 RepID=UPI00137AAB1A|nr:hypothetical protein [Pontibacter russatus]
MNLTTQIGALVYADVPVPQLTEACYPEAMAPPDGNLSTATVLFCNITGRFYNLPKQA